MGKHHTLDHAGSNRRITRTDLRNMALLMAALTVFVIAMIASYSGAFAKPTLHHLNVAVAGPQQLVDGIRGQDTLGVTQVADAGAARGQVYDRKTDAAFVVTPTGEMKIYVAGGGGRSVANAAEAVGRTVAAKAGLTATVEDVAPTSPGDPQGTVEFYAVIFLSIGATVGATLFGRMMGSVRRPSTLALRTLSLGAYSALLAGGVTIYVDGVLGALTTNTWQVRSIVPGRGSLTARNPVRHAQALYGVEKYWTGVDMRSDIWFVHRSIRPPSGQMFPRTGQGWFPYTNGGSHEPNGQGDSRRVSLPDALPHLSRRR